ncbi:Protein FAM13A [Triplophysa tibetana]|uniref:Protein FAM13A n=1 Tax=Triplophysa tibetana TaxID=1572043 RepID=A0A5A9PJM0_9TELE|nr:Protein FAM13A [Triplophysa tibetana]
MYFIHTQNNDVSSDITLVRLTKAITVTPEISQVCLAKPESIVPAGHHNKAAVQIKKDVKKMVKFPILKPSPAGPATGGKKIFGVSLLELKDMGLVKDGVPVVVRSMVEYIEKHGLHQEGLFRVNGSVRTVENLRQRFNAGEEVDLFQEADTFAVASLLKLFLRDLPEGLIHPSIHNPLIQLFQECSEDDFCTDVCELLRKLPEIHHTLLQYLCHFLSQVEQERAHNRMTVTNLATVFGPNVFHVSSGFDGIQEQNICNNIMAKLIQNYSTIFKSAAEKSQTQEDYSNIIVVKEAITNTENTEMSPYSSVPEANASNLKRMKVGAKVSVKQAAQCTPVENTNSPREKQFSPDTSIPTPRKKKVSKLSQSQTLQAASFLTKVAMSQAEFDVALVRVKFFSYSTYSNGFQHVQPLAVSKVKKVKTDSMRKPFPKPTPSGVPFSRAWPHLPDKHSGSGPQISPHASSFLEKTIRSAVQQHLFNVQTGQGSDGTEPTAHCSSPATTARERRRNLREQEGNLRVGGDKENVPSPGPRVTEAGERHLVTEAKMSRKPKHSLTLTKVYDNQDVLATPAMKIQEALCGAEPCDDVPRLDLTALTENNSWTEPVPAYSSWQRESVEREEAHLSPNASGKLIRQLLEEDSDPMVSPRFYAYRDSQQYLDDTEVPPSPPNAHSFISRRRSSSLGSCDDEREELTSAQLSKRIHVLKKKIRRFEEKFEEEHKYRPSHGDKAGNPEVLRWMNELARLRKDLKEHKLLKSEEDLTPLPRQRSNTLPKSFGSQLEKKTSETKAPKPPVENTLETVMNKLQEKCKEAGRPDEIKDMTREQIAAEKVALQKALLHFESIHGRPVTKNEREAMKPLYDRYRLVKQILLRASSIPVIGSPSSKRRGPLLQPIIEGVPALFFSDTKEEEEGSDEDSDTRTQFTVTDKPELSMLGLLDQLDEDTDGFISPVDELSPSKNTTDMRLSNLHAATMQELVEQLQEAREEKKRIRNNLREFEEEFFKLNGRNVQKEDRSPLAGEYNEYKHIKAKLRLLEVLISKRGSS